MGKQMSRGGRLALVCGLVAVASLSALSQSVGVTSAGAAPAPHTVTGLVFHDYTVDGVRQVSGGGITFTERGMSGIEIAAYDSAGNRVGTATTDSDGTYTLALDNTDTRDIRIEFETPQGYEPSFVGTDAGSAIQFITLDATTFTASDVNYAVHIPGEYCQANPNVYSTCMYPGTTNYNSSLGALRSTTWAGRTGPTTRLTKGAIGTTWGVAVQRHTGLVFTSAAIRRHAALGPKGLGGLYVTSANGNSVIASFDLTAAPYNLELAANLANYTDSARGITANQMSYDLPGYAGVGTEGIGDIDISVDGNYLFLTNLYRKSVVRIALTGDADNIELGDVTAFDIPTNLCAEAERPWALKTMADGTVLVGISCSDLRTYSAAITTQQKTELPEDAVVARLNPSGTGTWSIETEVSFNYARQTDHCTNTSAADPTTLNHNCLASRWHPWTNDWNNIKDAVYLGGNSTLVAWPQPIIHDIEVLDDGSLVLGIGDRLSLQIGANNYEPISGSQVLRLAWVYGDMMLMCRNGTGYSQESGGDCGTAYNSSRSLEFFNDSVHHNESIQGGIANHPSRIDSTLVGTFMDPVVIFSSGLVWFSHVNGNQSGTGLAFVEYDNVGSSTFQKASAMGDVEILCDMAPVQVGNRVWLDSDGDGVQDAGEPPISGVTVKLRPVNSDGSLGAAIATTTTNAKGEYYFSSTTTAAMTTGQPYVITFDNANDYGTNGPLDGMLLTSSTTSDAEKNSDASVDDSSVDSFGVSAFPHISVPALSPGVNVMTFDAGFVAPVSVGNYVWIDTDRDGIQDANETGVAGAVLTVTDIDGSPVTDLYGQPVGSQTTGPDGRYSFENLRPGQYKVSITYPEGYVATKAEQGSNNANDSHTNTATSVMLLSGQSDTTLDFGVIPYVSVGGIAWFDTNDNGVHDVDERLLSDIEMTVTDAQGRPVFDVFGNAVTTMRTDASGNYAFTHLPFGTYVVRVAGQPGMTVVRQSEISALLSTAGARDGTLDFRFVAKATVAPLSTPIALSALPRVGSATVPWAMYAAIAMLCGLWLVWVARSFRKSYCAK